jgi:Zn-dependent protease
MFPVLRTPSGVPILVHWSVPAIALFLLGVGVEHIVTSVAAVVSYVALLVIHELGHQLAAERCGSRVLSIRIYPIHGTCTFEQPRSRHYEALIAWGGPAAQIILAIPLVIVVYFIGYSRFQPINAVLAILGFLSPAIALYNLLPIPPLDGKKAWAIVPLVVGGVWRRRKPKPEPTAMEALQEALRKASNRPGA